MRIEILGARGSVPTEGIHMLEFGGATSCLMVQTDRQAIFLDAGSGMLNAPSVGDKEVFILLTHTHLDHLLGLPYFPLFWEKRHIVLYVKARGGLSAKEQVERLISPPLWPVGLEQYTAQIECRDLELPLTLGDITVEGMESFHPGGSTIYKLTQGEKSFVYATDYEHTEKKCRQLVSLAAGTDLLMYDAQYTEEEYEKHRGFGHSTVEEGLKVFRESGAKRILFVHHNPHHTDEILRAREADLKCANAAFAREGDCIEL